MSEDFSIGVLVSGAYKKERNRCKTVVSVEPLHAVEVEGIATIF